MKKLSRLKTRILLWSPTGAGLHYGGAGTNVYRLYNSETQYGLDFEVTLVCNNPEQVDYPLFKNVYRLGRAHKNSWLRQWLFLREAKEWLKENYAQFDVFHGIDIFESTVRPAFWAQSLGLPAFVKPAIYGSGLAPAKGWRRLLRLPQRRRQLMRKLSGIVVISQSIEDELLRYHVPQRLIHRIPNGVDTQLFHSSSEARVALRKRYGWGQEDIVLLFVGAICSRKQPDWIIRAAKELMQQQKHLRLVFVGPERETGYLEKLVLLAKASGSKERIHFFGHTEEVVEYYQAADMYCLPSAAEGMPNSVLEAMATGLPVIATRISGTEELINDGENGYLIESPKVLAEKLGNYVKDPGLISKHGRASLLRIEAKFSSAHVLGKYLAMFRSILD